MVAIFGEIMPEPLATPAIVTFVPAIRSVTDDLRTHVGGHHGTREVFDAVGTEFFRRCADAGAEFIQIEKMSDDARR